MKNHRKFWLMRFCQVAVPAFAALLMIYLARGRPLRQALLEALLWAGVTAAVYCIALYRKVKAARQCGACRRLD